MINSALLTPSQVDDFVEIDWPVRANVLGVMVSEGDYDDVVAPAIQSAKRRESQVVTAHPVHAIIEASIDPALREKVNSFAYVAADGQPVRWAMRLLHGIKMPERVYGPELMMRLCERAAKEGVSIFLYGSTDDVLEPLQMKLKDRIPGLDIAGAYSPPIRGTNELESDEVIHMINESGAGLVFVGLGCPKQDHFAYNHAHRIRGVQVCVGAAFDFHAGHKRMAPSWMQRNGLEWLFRLTQEPGRLWKRYLVTNTLFVMKFILAWLYFVPRRWAHETFGLPRQAPRSTATRLPRVNRRTTEIQEVTVVIPFYNDEETVAPLAQRLNELKTPGYEFNYVLVDDGSGDGTRSALELHFGSTTNYRIVAHSHNRGVAAAIQTGIQEADTDIVCSMDSDCTYDPRSLSSLIDLMADDVSVVTGSPYHPLGHVEQVPKWRIRISKLASRMYRLIFRNKLHTYTSCFRAYRRKDVERLQLRNSGFVGVVELLWQVDRSGGRIVGCPATLSVRTVGQSKMRVLKVSSNHLRFFLKSLFESVTGKRKRVRRPLLADATN